jgi:hypothetical protein
VPKVTQGSSRQIWENRLRHAVSLLSGALFPHIVMLPRPIEQRTGSPNESAARFTLKCARLEQGRTVPALEIS